MMIIRKEEGRKRNNGASFVAVGGSSSSGVVVVILVVRRESSQRKDDFPHTERCSPSGTSKNLPVFLYRGEKGMERGEASWGVTPTECVATLSALVERVSTQKYMMHPKLDENNAVHSSSMGMFHAKCLCRDPHREKVCLFIVGNLKPFGHRAALVSGGG